MKANQETRRQLSNIISSQQEEIKSMAGLRETIESQNELINQRDSQIERQISLINEQRDEIANAYAKLDAQQEITSDLVLSMHKSTWTNRLKRMFTGVK